MSSRGSGAICAFLEAPPFEATRAFILDMIEQGYPQLVVLSGGEVVGWCDVTPKPRPIYAHSGVLGMGLLPPFRGQGIGKRLMSQALAAARAFGLQRVELTVRENNKNAIALYQKHRLRDRRRAAQRHSGRRDLRECNLDGGAVLGGRPSPERSASMATSRSYLIDPGKRGSRAVHPAHARLRWRTCWAGSLPARPMSKCSMISLN